jgi:hypothetical protein
MRDHGSVSPRRSASPFASVLLLGCLHDSFFSTRYNGRIGQKTAGQKMDGQGFVAEHLPQLRRRQCKHHTCCAVTQSPCRGIVSQWFASISPTANNVVFAKSDVSGGDLYSQFEASPRLPIQRFSTSSIFVSLCKMAARSGALRCLACCCVAC